MLLISIHYFDNLSIFCQAMTVFDKFVFNASYLNCLAVSHVKKDATTFSPVVAGALGILAYS